MEGELTIKVVGKFLENGDCKFTYHITGSLGLYAVIDLINSSTLDDAIEDGKKKLKLIS